MNTTNRTKIVNALVTKLKTIDGTGVFNSNVFNNVFNRLKFYDEINDFPTLCVVAGSEQREYLPAAFKWGFLNVTIRAFVKSDEDPTDELENILADIEYILDTNNNLVYDTNKQITEIRIESIETDEGVLAPIGFGEISLVIRYDLPN